MTAIFKYFSPLSPDAREPALAPGFYDFDDGIDLISYPGVTVRGRAQIEIDQTGDWYIAGIELAGGTFWPLIETDPLYSIIKRELEGHHAPEIAETCAGYAAEER